MMGRRNDKANFVGGFFKRSIPIGTLFDIPAKNDSTQGGDGWNRVGFGQLIAK